MSEEQQLTPEIESRIHYWLTGPFDAQTQAEVKALKEHNPQELINAFFSDLSFGTGGLRALMGPGTTRMNIYTVRLATQGLANYLRKHTIKPKLSVLIGFDSRHHSEEFALEAARVLAGNGIHVYLLTELRPTPYISFACRHQRADAAIMITASHNPKEYNGYKVYWSDGAQVVDPHDTGIVREVEALTDLCCVTLTSPNDPLIEKIEPSFLDEKYLEAIAPLQHFSTENHQRGSSLKIVYTSLHGTGITIVPRALKEWGFTTVHFANDQITIDGNFPTVKFPNPEYKETLKLGIELLEKTGSDIVLATDPDADRVGACVMHEGVPTLISGNEMAAICVDYLCEILPKMGKMPKNGAFITTIVTTELLKKISTFHHRHCFEVLTGFKYIGEKIHLWELSKEHQFLFGAEESYGYLLGTHARDKDAIITCCLIAEIALHAKRQGQTLIDRLHHIYRTYGIFREKQRSLNFALGKEGMEHMEKVMQQLRSKPPSTIAQMPVVYLEDYETQERTFLETKHAEKLHLPASNVLLFRLQDNSRLVIRPSGTEPKIKIYGGATSEQFSCIEEGINTCDQRLDLYLDSLEALCLPQH